MFDLTALDVQNLASELVESLKLSHKFKKDAKYSGRERLFSFLKRNSVLSIQMPTATSIDRVKAFNKHAFGHFLPFIKKHWIHTEI